MLQYQKTEKGVRSIEIGAILAQLREEKNISQKELAKLLQHNGVQVTNQAISKWENGSTQPNASQFLTLCKILEITDISGIFLNSPTKTPLDTLNAEGKKKALEYIDLLIKSGMYSVTPIVKPTVLRSLPLYHLSVSAGTGQFLDSDRYDLVDVGEEVPMYANFGVCISGDSMQPRFINGQIVWVHQQQTIQNGEIGIFLYNGDAYCKKFMQDHSGAYLVSLNSRYHPIKIEENSDFRVFGKVVG